MVNLGIGFSVSVGVVVGRPEMPGADILKLDVGPLVERQITRMDVPWIGPFGIKEEEMPFPFLLAIAEEREGIDARLVKGVFETLAVECGQGVP